MIYKGKNKYTQVVVVVARKGLDQSEINNPHRNSLTLVITHELTSTPGTNFARPLLFGSLHKHRATSGAAADVVLSLSYQHTWEGQ